MCVIGKKKKIPHPFSAATWDNNRDNQLHSPCSEAWQRHIRPSSAGIPLPSPCPQLRLITLSSVLGDFPSETHPDFSLIPTSPSVTFPPLCSPHCHYSFNSLSLFSLALSPFLYLSCCILITRLTSGPTLINLTV